MHKKRTISSLKLFFFCVLLIMPLVGILTNQLQKNDMQIKCYYFIIIAYSN